MGKVGKKKKSGLADAKAQRLIEKRKHKDVDKRAANPFERRRVKKHHQVLGQRMKSAELDLGQARSKAQELRRHTLQLEHEQEGKRNAFVDRRIGENEESLSLDEKMLIRFQKERQRQLGQVQKNLYSLEEESLTHYGQSLATADYNFDRDEEEEEDMAGIGDEMVDEFHFGGGLFKKVVAESSGGKAQEHKTKDEVMKEIIAKSKYYKALHAQEKQEAEDLADALDTQFDDVLQFLPPGMTAEDREKSMADKDEFDVTVKELAFEARAKASDRMMSKEEIACAQRERLDFLEAERLKRMTQEEDDEEEDGGEVKGSRKRKRKGKKGGEEEEEMGGEVEDDLDGNLDFDEDEGESGDEEEEAPARKPASLSLSEQQLIEQNIAEDSMPFVILAPTDYDRLNDLVQRYCPGLEAAKLSDLLARIFASNNVSLGPSYRKGMEKFLVVLVQYFGRSVNRAAGKEEYPSAVIDVLATAIFRLAQDTPVQISGVAKKKLKALDASLSKHFAAASTGRGEDVVSPYGWKLADFMFLKLMGNVFSVSDFQHAVITPALLLLSSYLGFVPVTSGGHVVAQLFSCSLVLSYVKQGQRYSPEAINCLYTILFCAVTDESEAAFDDELAPATRKHLPAIVRLPATVSDSVDAEEAAAPLRVTVLLGKKPTSGRFKSDTFKYQVFSAALRLLAEYSELYAFLPSHPEIFSSFLPFLAKCKKLELPESVQAVVREVRRKVRGKVKEIISTRRPLQYADSRPVPLRALEPDFVDGYNPTKNYDLDQDEAESRKLRRKLKEETKGAVRELRKDNQYLENLRVEKQAAEDRERDLKYKQIMGELQMEQHQVKLDNKNREGL